MAITNIKSESTPLSSGSMTNVPPEKAENTAKNEGAADAYQNNSAQPDLLIFDETPFKTSKIFAKNEKTTTGPTNKLSDLKKIFEGIPTVVRQHPSLVPLREISIFIKYAELLLKNPEGVPDEDLQEAKKSLDAEEKAMLETIKNSQINIENLPEYIEIIKNETLELITQMTNGLLEEEIGKNINMIKSLPDETKDKVYKLFASINGSAELSAEKLIECFQTIYNLTEIISILNTISPYAGVDKLELADGTKLTKIAEIKYVPKNPSEIEIAMSNLSGKNLLIKKAESLLFLKAMANNHDIDFKTLLKTAENLGIVNVSNISAWASGKGLQISANEILENKEGWEKNVINVAANMRAEWIDEHLKLIVGNNIDWEIEISKTIALMAEEYKKNNGEAKEPSEDIIKIWKDDLNKNKIKIGIEMFKKAEQFWIKNIQNVLTEEETIAAADYQMAIALGQTAESYTDFPNVLRNVTKIDQWLSIFTNLQLIEQDKYKSPGTSTLTMKALWLIDYGKALEKYFSSSDVKGAGIINLAPYSSNTAKQFLNKTTTDIWDFTTTKSKLQMPDDPSKLSWLTKDLEESFGVIAAANNIDNLTNTSGMIAITVLAAMSGLLAGSALAAGATRLATSKLGIVFGEMTLIQAIGMKALTFSSVTVGFTVGSSAFVAPLAGLPSPKDFMKELAMSAAVFAILDVAAFGLGLIFGFRPLLANWRLPKSVTTKLQKLKLPKFLNKTKFGTKLGEKGKYFLENNLGPVTAKNHDFMIGKYADEAIALKFSGEGKVIEQVINKSALKDLQMMIGYEGSTSFLAFQGVNFASVVYLLMNTDAFFETAFSYNKGLYREAETSYVDYLSQAATLLMIIIGHRSLGNVKKPSYKSKDFKNIVNFIKETNKSVSEVLAQTPVSLNAIKNVDSMEVRLEMLAAEKKKMLWFLDAQNSVNETIIKLWLNGNLNDFSTYIYNKGLILNGTDVQLWNSGKNYKTKTWQESLKIFSEKSVADIMNDKNQQAELEKSTQILSTLQEIALLGTLTADKMLYIEPANIANATKLIEEFNLKWKSKVEINKYKYEDKDTLFSIIEHDKSVFGMYPIIF